MAFVRDRDTTLIQYFGLMRFNLASSPAYPDRAGTQEMRGHRAQVCRHWWGA